MAILDSDPIKTLKVGDIYNIQWRGYSSGNGSEHNYYRDSIEQVCTKFRNLVVLDEKAIKLFITPQFEAPYHIVEITNLVPGYLVKILETQDGAKKRLRENLYSIKGLNQYFIEPRLIYKIEITLK